MTLNAKQKKYLKKQLHHKQLDKLAEELNISIKEIEKHLIKRWGKEKYQRFLQRTKQTTQTASTKLTLNWQEKVINLNLKSWLKQNNLAILILIFLVFIAYVNGLASQFVADDVAVFLDNPDFGKFSYVFQGISSLIRNFIFFFIHKFFGLTPFFYRLFNLFNHLGSVIAAYFLVSLLINDLTAFLTAVILAIHPIQIEAVTWVSGGPYSQSAFFMLLSLSFYLFSIKKQKYYYYSLISFLLALFSSEKSMAFPLILLAFLLSYKLLKQNWKKLIPYFSLSGLWALIYVSQIPQRISETRTLPQEQGKIFNPLAQIPIAISSYLKLIFFPKDLTLYHSEMVFSYSTYFIYLIIFFIFLATMIYCFKKQRQLFFWQSLFFISLLPTLTPLGVSWIVAERYVYFGAIGIFTVIAFLVQKLIKKPKTKKPAYIAFALILLLLTIRTIRRNIDWKNQDNLWLAAAKTSPSSSQNRNNLGDLYARQGDPDRAITEFKKAIELKPDYAEAYHNLANVYQRQGKIELAIEAYQQAIKFKPSLWQSYQNLASIYFDQQAYQQAEENLQQAIQINPNISSLHQNLALIYLKQNKTQEAEKELEISLQLEPNNQQVQILLEKIRK